MFASQYAPAISAKLVGIPLPSAALDSATDSIGGAFAVAAQAGGNPDTIDTPVGVQIADAARDAFSSSMGRGLLVSAGIALIGAIVALVFLPAHAAPVAGAVCEMFRLMRPAAPRQPSTEIWYVTPATARNRTRLVPMSET